MDKRAALTEMRAAQQENRPANLDGVHLEGVNLTAGSLFKANLEGAHLGGAYLEGANLGGAHLYKANLEGAYLEGANLYGANLEGANLTRANLYGANLEGANLEGANLGGAHLYKANLEGADVREVKFRLSDLLYPKQQPLLDSMLEQEFPNQPEQRALATHLLGDWELSFPELLATVRSC